MDLDAFGDGAFGEGTGGREDYFAEGSAGKGVLPYPADGGGDFYVGQVSKAGEGEITY